MRTHNTLWRDEWGMLRIGWIIAGLVLGTALLIALVFAAVKPLNEASCNQSGEHLPGVTAADYRLLSDTCWLTLEDGREIPFDSYRVTDPR